ncbi:MAG TPA: DNA replication/repair protein RecF [Acidimicrobiales bacterium]|nr:DNA replication/repair protein RecF [Acidimicrobiales bacterium]
MQLERLWLADFRNYAAADVVLAPDALSVVVGGNGQGKTNLIEAVAYLATLSSFRGAPPEALVRTGAASAVVRAEGRREGRDLLIEVEINPAGRSRTLVNHQPLRRAADLLGALRVTLFSPDDLELVKAGPSGRRRWLDDALTALHPRNAALRADAERVLRQRNALLKQCRGRLDPSAAATLDVWDAKWAAAGEALAAARAGLVGAVEIPIAKAYDQVAGAPADVGVGYERSWDGPLAAALAAARDDDVRRGLTTTGPHRDELRLTIGGVPARTHASQGEQRSLALALRLAVHAAVAEAVGEPPVLLLDDVFSELDPDRSAALVAHLPDGQALLTTAGAVPDGIRPALTLRMSDGRIL